MGSGYFGGIYVAEYANAGSAPVITFRPSWAMNSTVEIGPIAQQPVLR